MQTLTMGQHSGLKVVLAVAMLLIATAAMPSASKGLIGRAMSKYYDTEYAVIKKIIAASNLLGVAAEKLRS